MYSCEQIIAELASYIDDEMSEDLRRGLEMHLSQCQTCRVLYDSVRKTLRIVTESQSFELPPEISDRIVSKIMSRVDPRFKSPPRK